MRWRSYAGGRGRSLQCWGQVKRHSGGGIRRKENELVGHVGVDTAEILGLRVTGNCNDLELHRHRIEDWCGHVSKLWGCWG